ncbi:glycoside hydrolase superfamily [Chytriomyces sp. MP71]|nr:glycoside hydrolase superfamily [Chytriomyces sp. MP71]
MWAGVEPERGVYNYTYLNTIKTIVQRCSDAGIYVLLDFHQDIFSEKFCGEGVPLWAANPSGGRFGFPFPLDRAYPVNETGIPSDEDCGKHDWATYQATPAVSEAYQRLYDNYEGYRDAFTGYWELVALTLLPFKNILGYDIINEPWNGNVVKDPSLSNPFKANRKNLQPLYDVVAEGIRSVDPNAMIFFESVTTVQKTVGFEKTPGSPQFASKSVLSYHYYSSVQKQYDIQVYKEFPSVQLFTQGMQATIGFRVQHAVDLQCGSMLTEFEMGNGDDEEYGANLPNILATTRAADSYFMSYTGWEYTDYIKKTGTNNGIRNPKTGAVRPGMAAAYSRTHAHAIAGAPTFMEFNDESGLFTFKFVYNGARGPGSVTELRTNFGVHYPGGYVVRIEGPPGFQVLHDNGKDARGRIFIVPKEVGTGGWPVAGSEVAVTVSRKEASNML